jgi:hypothetical protein
MSGRCERLGQLSPSRQAAPAVRRKAEASAARRELAHLVTEHDLGRLREHRGR